MNNPVFSSAPYSQTTPVRGRCLCLNICYRQICCCYKNSGIRKYHAVKMHSGKDSSCNKTKPMPAAFPLFSIILLLHARRKMT